MVESFYAANMRKVIFDSARLGVGVLKGPFARPTRQMATRKGEDGKLVAFENEPIPVTRRRALISGGVGLVSTGADLLKFAQFVLDDGAVSGKRLLSAKAARQMRADAIPAALKPIGPNGYMAGSGWTLGGLAIDLRLGEIVYPPAASPLEGVSVMVSVLYRVAQNDCSVNVP
jgi:CubicO group peptidase (beta-lactamase class C family)